MKIVRTISIISATVIGAGLLSSCASNRASAHHHHNGRYHDHHHHGQHQHHHRHDGRHHHHVSKAASKKHFAMSFDEVKSKARKGDADAQYALGYMYYYGQDVDRSADKARFWISKAADQGQERAVTALRLLGSTNNQFAANSGPSNATAQNKKLIKTAKTGRGLNSGRRTVLAQNDVQQGNQSQLSQDRSAAAANSGRKASNPKYTRQNFRKGSRGKGFNKGSQRGKSFNNGVAQRGGSDRFAKNAGQRGGFNNSAAQAGFSNDGAQGRTGYLSNSRQATQASAAGNNVQAGVNNGAAQASAAANNAQAGFNNSAAQAGAAANNAASTGSAATQQGGFNNSTQGNSAGSVTTGTQTRQSSNSDSGKQIRVQNTNTTTPAPVTQNTQVASASDASSEITTANGITPQLTSGEKILLSMPNDHYTLQLFGARQIETAERIIAKSHLDNNAKIYHTTFQNRDWYVLVYGDFSSPSEAMSAISKLPAEVQKLKPWVKPIASVKESIRASLIG